MALDGWGERAPLDRVRLTEDGELGQHSDHLAALDECEHGARVVDAGVDLRLEARLPALPLDAPREGRGSRRGAEPRGDPARPRRVDLDALPAFLERERPALIALGGSLMLFPHRLKRIAPIARAAGARVLYDASHVAGLIAGGRFQDPLGDGVDVVTFSTYKSFGGPPGGVIATNDTELAQRISAAVYPGLTANYDAGRFRALGIAAAALLEYGTEYAARCIDSAQALARSLHDHGLRVAGADRGFTDSHHVAIALPDATSGGSAVGRLARAGVFLSATQIGSANGPVAALRLGTQELVRRGFGPSDMAAVAGLITRVLAGGEAPCDVRPDVVALRGAACEPRASPTLIGWTRTNE